MAGGGLDSFPLPLPPPHSLPSRQLMAPPTLIVTCGLMPRVTNHRPFCTFSASNGGVLPVTESQTLASRASSQMRLEHRYFVPFVSSILFSLLFVDENVSNGAYEKERRIFVFPPKEIWTWIEMNLNLCTNLKEIEVSSCLDVREAFLSHSNSKWPCE